MKTGCGHYMGSAADNARPKSGTGSSRRINLKRKGPGQQRELLWLQSQRSAHANVATTHGTAPQMLSTNGATDAAATLKIGNQYSGDADDVKISIRTTPLRSDVVW